MKDFKAVRFTILLVAVGLVALSGCADDGQELNSSSSALTGEAATADPGASRSARSRAARIHAGPSSFFEAAAGVAEPGWRRRRCCCHGGGVGCGEAASAAGAAADGRSPPS